ncbi:unnamed protein product [Rhizopus microsporus]
MLASGNTQNLPTDLLDDEKISYIRELFSTYGSNYKFKNGSIYYDCKAKPLNHLKAYYTMTKLCKQSGRKSFTCFPLRKTYIPCYMTINTMILNHHIVLDSPQSKLDKTLIWGKVVNLSSKALKDQGKSKIMKFQGMIQTGSIGVSVLKQNKETSKGGTKGIRMKNDDECQYINKLNGGTISLIAYKYTIDIIKQAKETKSRKFSKLRQNTKPEEIKQSEAYLSKHPASTLNVLQFAEYLKARARMKLSSIVNKQQSDSRLSAKIRKKFGNDSVIVIGDWSAANQKYHLIDKHKTSSLCPTCKNGELEKFAKVPNPRTRQPIVLCHGLQGQLSQ